MRTKHRVGLLVTLVALVLGASLLAARSPKASESPDELAQMRSVELGLIATAPQGSLSELYFVSPGHGLPLPAASFEHLPGAVVRGVSLPHSRVVLAVADSRPSRELSWSASLVRLEAGQVARTLVDDVYHASRPLVTQEGLVFVQRGRAGQEPSAEQNSLRLDDLAIDQVDPSTGATQRVYSWSGYEAHLAGSYRGELFVYRVGPQGADLVAISLQNLQLRTIVPSWPPMARDFSVDPADGSIVLQQANDGLSPGFHVERVDTKTGTRNILVSDLRGDVSPFAFPKRRLLISPETESNLVLVGSNRLVLRGLPAQELLWARKASDDGAYVGALSVRRGALPIPILVDAETGLCAAVPFPQSTRVEVVGVYGSAQ
jgi:hypothetical protein